MRGVTLQRFSVAAVTLGPADRCSMNICGRADRHPTKQEVAGSRGLHTQRRSEEQNNTVTLFVPHATTEGGSRAASKCRMPRQMRGATLPRYPRTTVSYLR